MYLTESRLGEFLTKLFPNHMFVHDKTVPNSGIKNRPDYRNDELMLIVEFDGYQHYTKVAYIESDCAKDRVYTQIGYTVVRIPYFVQLSTEVIGLLFNLKFDYAQIYGHGFIDKDATLPSDFCEMGIERFKLDLIKFESIAPQIIKSLKNKLNELNAVNLVLPKSLTYLLN